MMLTDERGNRFEKILTDDSKSLNHIPQFL